MPSEARLENFSIWTLKKEHIKEIICRAKRGKKIMEKLNRAQKCSILGPQNLGSGGARAPGPPGPPLDPHLKVSYRWSKYLNYNLLNMKLYLLFLECWWKKATCRSDVDAQFALHDETLGRVRGWDTAHIQQRTGHTIYGIRMARRIRSPHDRWFNKQTTTQIHQGWFQLNW